MNTSWPLPAAISAAATAWIRSTGMWSTTTLVSCCRPHSSASTPANHPSYPGRKCAHLPTLRPGCRSTPPSGRATKGPTAAPAAHRVKPAGDGRRPGSGPAAIDLSLLEPGVVLQALSVGSRKVPLLLEAIEVGVECRVERGAVHLLNLIQESVWGDRSVARIQDGRADDPDRSSIGTVHGLVSFVAASLGFGLVGQLIGRR